MKKRKQQNNSRILFLAQTKLRSFAVLFRSLNNCVIDQDDLYGFAIILEEISEELQIIHQFQELSS